MSNILERIIQISDNEKITISKIERIIGASKGVLHKAIQNKTDISSKWVVLIAENFTQYNSEWLLTGKGNMIRDVEEKKEVISNPMADKDNYIIELQKKEIATLEEKLQQCQDEKKLLGNNKLNV